MKTGKTIIFFVIVFTCFMLAACGTVSPDQYAQAKAPPANVPHGQSRITQDSLAGVWRDEAGVVYAFQGNTFQSNALDNGRPGRYEISPVLSSYLLVFYRDRNVEGFALFGLEFYHEVEQTRERDTLSSNFAVLSEDRQTLIIGDRTFTKVGL